jgi:hypothetical protein
MPVMGPSEEIRHALSQWCTARIPEEERGRRQIGYTVQGAEVTIIDRRAPAHPRLDAGWTSTPLALLRLDPDGSGRWTLYRPAADGGWTRTSEGDDPIALLAAQAPA